MSHEIAEKTNGQAAIAFIGEKPWHGLGQALTPGQSIETWRVEAGLDYEVKRSQVQYEAQIDWTLQQKSEVTGEVKIITGHDTPELLNFKARDVLYRSDTGKALSVVSKDYKVVQPSQILDFFAKLSEIGGFELETAGVLSGGRRVWALAKVGDGNNIIGQDEVRPYVLFATSYDGTMATTAKMTAIRVVCNNTITMALGRGYAQAGKTEADTENKAVSSLIRIPHSAVVDNDDIRQKLGIVGDVYEQWLINTRLMAEKSLSDEKAAEFLKELLDTKSEKPVEETKAYKRIMELFQGEAIGANLAGDHNCWAMVNACTQYVDWERGKNPDTRLAGAWFGSGEALKNKAYDLLLA